MVDRVAASEIETLVGIERHRARHFGRADSVRGKFFILHSDACRRAALPLADCDFSLALERGINEADWYGHEDRPVALWFDEDGRLIPHRTPRS